MILLESRDIMAYIDIIVLVVFIREFVITSHSYIAMIGMLYQRFMIRQLKKIKL